MAFYSSFLVGVQDVTVVIEGSLKTVQSLLILWKYFQLIPDIGLVVWVFANGPGDLGSVPGRVIPKTQKMVLDASLLNTQHYKVRIKGKVEQSREGVAPSPTPWCSSYWKGSLRVTLDYGHQFTYFIFNYLGSLLIMWIQLCLGVQDLFSAPWYCFIISSNYSCVCVIKFILSPCILVMSNIPTAPLQKSNPPQLRVSQIWH